MRALLALTLAAAALALPPTAAIAAELSPLLTQFPEDATKGSGANQLDVPRAIETDPTTGAVYVAESGNHRISKFDAWGVFVKAWGWGVKDGSAAPQTCGPSEPELSPPASLCQKGISGPGPGQMNAPNGVAVDASGNVYVLERNNARVQKFDAAGQFVLMFGGEVNKTTNAGVCTAASGDVCGVGIKGTANGFFEPPFSFVGNYLAIGSDGTVYVGDKDRIQEFEPDGTFKGQIKFSDLNAEDGEFPAAGNVGTLGFDAKSGDLYFSRFEPGVTPSPPVFRVDAASGKAVDVLPVEAPSSGVIEALVTDAKGDIYVALYAGAAFEPRVIEFGPSGEVLIPFAEAFASPAPVPIPSESTELLGLGTNGVGDVYVAENAAIRATSAVSAYGPPPIKYGPPPKVAPEITEQFATAVDTSGATVKATINPHFWTDTTYYLEYGTQSCEASACAKHPTPPGATLTSEVVNTPLTSAGVFLDGLSPNTTYHYRFVAQGTGGGPVKGLSGKAGEEAEATFTTAALPVKQPPCPANEAFRPGPAAVLPDCRAYEMVSPVDKNGADISVVFNSLGDPTGLDQAATDGEKLSYSAYRAFGEVESSPYTSQYLATRSEGVGWTSKGISPPREGPSLYSGGPGLDSQFKGFSEDLCQGWLLQDSDVSLVEGWVEGFPNLYRRDLCAGGYATLAPPKAPIVGEVNEFRPELQGFSADGSVAIFVAKGKLTNNATATVKQLYEAEEGKPLRLVCILPDKTAVKVGCSGGTGNGGHPDRSASVSHAISENGSTIYWTESAAGPGKLYVRLNHAETFAVNEGSAQFWAAAADGSKAIYSVGGELLEFDLASKTSESIAKGFQGMLGASEDASKVYFVSSEVLAAGGTLGKPNLYLYEAGEPGSFSFIATLASADLAGQLSPVSKVPIQHTAQVSADGAALAFMSTASLTGYDNVDAASGQADAEVYLYRAGPDALLCASCNPTGARPAGRNIAGSIWAAAQIPVAENQLHFPRVLSANGNRLFFESFDPLALRDTNAKQDVYQWEAEGSGNCAKAAPGFNPSLEGCLNLISSGESPQDSEIVDSSADGRDVFLKTASSLLPQDPGLVDIYDARAGGGFPLQGPPPPECLGEACQAPTPAPNDPTPASAGIAGPGNPRAHPSRCRKGKVRRRGRCVRRGKRR